MALPHLERHGGERELAGMTTSESTPSARQQKTPKQGGDAG